MNIDEMPAGRETDVLVAEKVMGCIPCDKWTPVLHPEAGWLKNCQCQACYPAGDPAYYSTNIVAAFVVVDKLLDGTRTFTLECWSLKNDHWQAMFKGGLNWEAAQYEQLDDAFAETRPLAICRAALKLVKRKGEEETAKVNCQHELFKCQVPASDSCVAIYHQVCRKCRWDETKSIFMPLHVWRRWAVPQLEKLQNHSGDER